MPQILQDYEEDLGVLKDTVVGMGTLVVAAIEKSTRALFNGPLDLCYDVIEDDEAIDQYEKRVDEQGMAILLRFNPGASDLRHVLSSINISRSLERIGDHAVNIAKRTRKILRTGEINEIRLAEPLVVEVRRVLSSALVAFSDGNEETAHAVIKMDDRVDQLHRALSNTLTQQIAGSTRGAESLLNLIFISRSLERIGDLAVNVAEDIVFAASAENIRHT